MADREHAYATDEAMDGAERRGFRLSLADWRAIFLAITDTFATDGNRSNRANITASLIGPVRQGERWTIFVGSKAFDALYDKHAAIVYRVVDTPSAMAERAPVKGPTLTSRVLVTA